MDNKEDVRQYVAGFIKQKKGPDKVAADTGISRQTLYQIIRGRNNVSRKTIDRLGDHYDDFKRTEIVNIDIQPSHAEPAKSKAVDSESSSEELIRLRIESEYKDKLIGDKDRRIEELEELVEYFKKDKDQLYQTVQRQTVDGNFLSLNDEPQSLEHDKFYSDSQMWLVLTPLYAVKPIIV